jgi:hypothetical protein
MVDGRISDKRSVLAIETFLSDLDVVGTFFDAEPMATQTLGGRCSGARSEERVNDKVVSVCRAGDEFLDKIDGFLRGVTTFFF